jgi:hypothetical protein
MSGINGRIISVYERVAWKAENVEEKYPAFMITFEDGTQKLLVATTKEKEELYRETFEKINNLYNLENAIVKGIRCRACNVVLEPHTRAEHFDINHCVHSCERGHKNK